mgnify:CR=1 FL=1
MLLFFVLVWNYFISRPIYICQYSGCGCTLLSLHSHSKILTFLCMIPNPIRIFQKEFCFRVVRAAAQSAVLPSDFDHNFSFGWKDWVKILNSSEFRFFLNFCPKKLVKLKGNQTTNGFSCRPRVVSFQYFSRVFKTTPNIPYK